MGRKKRAGVFVRIRPRRRRVDSNPVEKKVSGTHLSKLTSCKVDVDSIRLPRLLLQRPQTTPRPVPQGHFTRAGLSCRFFSDCPASWTACFRPRNLEFTSRSAPLEFIGLTGKRHDHRPSWTAVCPEPFPAFRCVFDFRSGPRYVFISHCPHPRAEVFHAIL